MPKVICIVPARVESARFPNKIFTPIHGKAMFHRVFEIAQKSGVFDQVYIASHNEAVQQWCTEHDLPFLRTSEDHLCGSSRVFEAARSLDMPWDIVVNLQADQPFLPEAYLQAVVDAFQNNPIATVAYPDSAAKDEHTVKVVLNKHGEGLYFSREAIPHATQGAQIERFCHLGLYAYKRDFVENYLGQFNAPMALSEGLEQLDFLYHGHKIDVGIVPSPVPEVNVPEDLETAKKLGLL